MIASDADVDPALVMHYFGNKVDLFGAAMHLPLTPTKAIAELTDVEPDKLGEGIVRTITTVWDHPDGLAVWLGLLRSAASDQKAALMLKEFLTTAILQPIAATLDDDDADYRLSLVASQVVGVGVARFVIGLEPLASASNDELVAAIAPTLQRYLTGDLPVGRPT